ncbi:MAG: class I SAM-dependent methyltransferase [Pseudomonadales bacterium]
MSKNEEQRIVASWHRNADAWTRAVREQEITSRRLITDTAILQTILRLAPETVLDIGCGEGWLVRALMERNIGASGVDCVPALIANAEQAGGRFQCLSYADLAVGKMSSRYDLAVCNFSLFGDQSVRQLFKAVPDLLVAGGYFVVQTLHPVASCVNGEYRDGWQQGSWAGFSRQFVDPAPWYFRTKASWLALFHEHGFNVENVQEPVNPETGSECAMIFTVRCAES